MSVERPLPKLRQTRAVSIVLGFAALTAASLFWSLRSDSMQPFWLVAVGLIAVVISFYYRRRCPQCSRRMMFRAEPLRWQAGRSRILFDCKNCDVVWDSGEIQDENLG